MFIGLATKHKLDDVQLSISYQPDLYMTEREFLA